MNRYFAGGFRLGLVLLLLLALGGCQAKSPL